METDLVIYHNDLNKVRLPNFTAQEQDILMGIICKIKEKHINQKEIIFTANELTQFTRLRSTLQEQTKIINSLKKKFFKADFTIIINDPDKKIFAEKTTNLFKSITIEYIDSEYKKIDRVKLSINEDFSYLLFKLLGNFTSFELTEFLNISSKYSKTLYRILKQFKNTGKCLIYKDNWELFCEIMNIPLSYNISDIDKLVLQQTIKDLSNIFKNLTYKKIKDPKGRGRGGKVIGIEFYFDTQKLTNY